MNTCSSHQNQNILFECCACKKKLCKECQPVAYRDKIFCQGCSDQTDSMDFSQNKKKTFLSKFPKFEKYFYIGSAIFLFFIFSYYFFWRIKVIEIKPDNRERIAFYLSLAYEAGKDTRIYNRQMKNILRLNQSFRNLIGHIEKGDNLKHAKKFKQALSYYKKIQIMLPDWDHIYLLLAECYINLNNLTSAKNQLQQAIELTPDKTDAYMMLGEINKQEGHIEKAILQYSKAMFIDDKNAHIPMALSKLYIQKHNISKAREYRDKARTLGADTKEVDGLIMKLTVKN